MTPARVAQVLEKSYGYSVRVLTENVSLANLTAVFDERFAQGNRGRRSAPGLLRGPRHCAGWRRRAGGYLVPQDASRQDKASFLAMTDLNRWLDKLPCRHLLLVLDCCFAGAYRWSSTRDLGTMPEVIHRERFDRYIKDPAWQVITSAAYDQKALDVLAGEILGSRGARARDRRAFAVRLGLLAGTRKGRGRPHPARRAGQARRRRRDHGDGTVSLSP